MKKLLSSSTLLLVLFTYASIILPLFQLRIVESATGSLQLAAVLCDFTTPECFRVKLAESNVSMRAGEMIVRKLDGDPAYQGWYFALIFAVNDTKLVEVNGLFFQLYISRNNSTSLSPDDKSYGPLISTPDLYSEGLKKVFDYYVGNVSIEGSWYSLIIGPIPSGITQDYMYIKVFDGDPLQVAVSLQRLDLLPYMELQPPHGPPCKEAKLVGTGLRRNALLDLVYVIEGVEEVFSQVSTNEYGMVSYTWFMRDLEKKWVGTGPIPNDTLIIRVKYNDTGEVVSEFNYTEFRRSILEARSLVRKHVAQPFVSFTTGAGDSSLVIKAYSNDELVIAGAWWCPTQPVEIFLDGVYIKTELAEPIYGFFNTTITLADLIPGLHYLELKQGNLSVVYLVNISIVSPTLYLIPEEGPPRRHVTMNGVDLAPGTVLNITYEQDPGSDLITQVLVDENGEFTYTWRIRDLQSLWYGRGLVPSDLVAIYVWYADTGEYVGEVYYAQYYRSFVEARSIIYRDTVLPFTNYHTGAGTDTLIVRAYKGDDIVIAGAWWSPAEEVAIYLEGDLLKTITPDEELGTFNTTITLPEDIEPGEYDLIFAQGDIVYTIVLMVLEPALWLEPTEGAPCIEVTLMGTGLRSNELLDMLYVINGEEELIDQIWTNDLGEFTYTWKIIDLIKPWIGRGAIPFDYINITVRYNSTGESVGWVVYREFRRSFIEVFSVIYGDKALVFQDPYTGAGNNTLRVRVYQGDIVYIAGAWWCPELPVEVYLNNVLVDVVTPYSIFGLFNASIQIPINIEPGSYVIKFIQGGVVYTLNITVLIPLIIVQPLKGPPCIDVMFAGSGLRPSKLLDIVYEINGIEYLITQLGTDEEGNFTYTWKVVDLLKTWSNQGSIPHENIVIRVRYNETGELLKESTFIQYYRSFVEIRSTTENALLFTDYYVGAGNDTVVVNVYWGDELVIAGAWWSLCSNISIYIDNTSIANVTPIAPYGFFNITITIPPLYPGEHVIRVVQGNIEYVFYIVVNIRMILEIEPNKGYVGDVVTIHGVEFPPNTNVSIYWTGCQGTVEIATTTTDEHGNFTLDIIIPLDFGGIHEITACANSYCNSVYFIILPKIEVRHSVTGTNVFENDGELFYVIASGLVSNANYLVLVDNQLTFPQLSTGVCGYFNITLIAAGFNPGIHVLTVYPATLGYKVEPTVYKTFLVTCDKNNDICILLNNVKAKIEEINGSILAINVKLGYINDTLTARLDQIEFTIMEIYNDVAYVLVPGIGYLMASLEEIRELIEENNAVLSAVVEGIAIVITDVGEIRVKLDALELLTIEISDNMAFLLTEIGVIKTDLENIKNLIDLSREAIITEISNNVLTIKLLIGETTTDIKAKIDALGELLLMNIDNKTAVLLTEIGVIKIGLSDLHPVIISINGSVATLITEIGIVKANLTTLRNLIESGNAVLAEIRNGIMIINTDIATIMANVSAIRPIIEAISGDVAIIKTDIGYIIANLTTLNPVVIEIRDGVARVKTDLGILIGVVEEINGTIALIKTDVGIVKATVQYTSNVLSETKESVNRLQSSIEDVKQTTNILPGVSVAAWIAAIFSVISAGLSAVTIKTMRKTPPLPRRRISSEIET